MSDETKTNPEGTPPPAAADASATTPQVDPWKALADSVGYRNPDEIKAAMKANRENQKKLAEHERALGQLLPLMQQLTKLMPQEEKTESKAEAKTETVKAKADVMALKVAFMEYQDAEKVNIPPDVKKRLVGLYEREQPQDVETWLSETVAVFGVKKAEPATQAPPKVAALPAPGVDAKTHLPDDILKLPPGVAKGMSNTELKAYWERYKRSNGMTVDAGSFRSKPIIPSKG